MVQEFVHPQYAPNCTPSRFKCKCSAIDSRKAVLLEVALEIGLRLRNRNEELPRFLILC